MLCLRKCSRERARAASLTSNAISFERFAAPCRREIATHPSAMFANQFPSDLIFADSNISADFDVELRLCSQVRGASVYMDVVVAVVRTTIRSHKRYHLSPGHRSVRSSEIIQLTSIIKLTLLLVCVDPLTCGQTSAILARS